MSIKLIEFKAEHIRYVFENVFEPISGTPEQREAWIQQREAEGTSYTGIVDDQIVACGGVSILWPGVADAWISVRKDANGYARAILECTRMMLDVLRDSHELRRIHAYVRMDFERGVKFAHKVGFEIESRMKMFMPDGADCYMMVRL